MRYRLKTALIATFALLFCTLPLRADSGPIRVSDYQGPIRVACVGDSITYGATIKYRLRDSYPAQLGRLLGDKWLVRNFGVSGATLLRDGDKPYWKEQAFSNALEFMPDVVIIKLGTNDTKPQNQRFKDRLEPDYCDMIDAFAKLASKPRIWICRPVPVYQTRWGISEDVLTDVIMPVVNKVAREKGVGLIDLYQPMQGKEPFFSDKIHPNAAGAAIMASVVCKTLTGAAPPANGSFVKPANVLIIGDSISIGYFPFVKELMRDRATLVHNQGNAAYTAYGLANLDKWLGDTHWDVIHFNHGLHDLKYIDDKGRNVAVARGHQQIPIDQYEANLDKLASRLEKTGAKLIFANTTPVPDGTGFRVKGDSAKYNIVAEKVMKKHGIPVDDLYSCALQRLDKIQRPQNVHFYPDGYFILAEKVAAAIDKQLGEPTVVPVPPFEGRKSQWNGFDRYDFKFNGKDSIVVAPAVTAPGRPWIWRARFFGHEPQTDIALLSKGFHLVYTDVADLYGGPAAVDQWNRFYDEMTGRYGLNRKAALEGMSRGGLIIFNWASANPDKVACIYADAPVCDIQSWPGGKGKGPGSPDDWRKCLQAYGLTEAQAAKFKGNPIDRLKPLATAGIPLLHVCGGADEVVPLAENTAILEQRYKKLGGSITTIVKPGVGHHPHSLKDPKRIVDFICKNTGLAQGPFAAIRDDLANSRLRFARDKKGRVAFLGGSITNMNGWRPMVAENLRKRFPDTDFEFINAGIPSTDSTLGAFRLANDVFAGGKVDLMFVEFAVNDEDNRRGATERIRGMEGIIRQARKLNPYIDIVLMYFADPVKYEEINCGLVPPENASHEEVARHYDIPSIDLSAEVAARLNVAEFTWQDFGGVHPGPLGHKLYAEAIERLFNTLWKGRIPANASPIAHPMPEKLLDKFSYVNGHYVDLKQAKLGSGWRMVDKWNTNQGATRPRFRDIPMLVADKSGAEMTLGFDGRAVGVLVVAGPDVGCLQYRVDNGPLRTVDQFTQWSPSLNIPWAYMLETELSPGHHELKLKTADEKNPGSKGNAARIVKFLVN